MDDSQIQRGQQWLTEFLTLSGFPATVAADTQHSDGSCWLTIDSTALTPDQVQALLNNHGSALDAIQYLANTAVNVGETEDHRTAFTIEIDGYRVQRQTVLEDLAEAAIAHVRDTGTEYEMPSLSAAERRQLHTYIKEVSDLETYSRGREPDRRLVVCAAGSGSTDY
jgi:spoIIIJ-associated protein